MCLNVKLTLFLFLFFLKLPMDHGDEALVKFAAQHFQLMKLMSKHLVHRKKGISANDMNGGSALASLGGD